MILPELSLAWSQLEFINARRCATALAAALVLASPTGSAFAQRSLPFSDDALVLGFGQVRSGIHGSWQFYDELYSQDGKLNPYGSGLSFASVGSAQFSRLSTGEGAIRTVSGQSGFQLSLGATNVSATHRSGSTALLLDIGLPARFMVSVEVPLVRVETTLNLTANNGTTSSANVGINPASTSATIFAADTALGNQITRARTALNSQLASCLGSTTPSCAVVNARRSEAQTLVATSATISAGVLTIASSPFAPLSATAAQAAITARIASLVNSYRDFGINTITGTTTGSATVPITAAQYRAFLENSNFGPGGALPSYKALTRLGDISLGAKFRIADTDRVRAAAFGKVYFPTGGKTPSGEIFPLSAGEGTTRTEVGGIADLFLGSKLSFTGSGSSVIWLANNVSTGSTRNRRTGFNFSATPRYAFNRWMVLGAQYEMRKLSREQFSGLGIDDIPVWNQQGAITENRIGAGFSFSNMDASRTTGPRFPLEASFFHSQSISGSGLQPKIFSDEFRIRIFARR